MSSWFFSSAVMVAAILGIRLLVKDRVSHRLRYGLWFPVLLRMLIPVNFARSSLSLEQVLPSGASAAIPELPTQIWYTSAPNAAEPAASGNPWQLLWLAGATAVLGCFVFSRLVLEYHLRRDRVLRENVCCSVPVYLTAAVKVPCQVGLFRPAVYVTEASVGEDTLPFVLRHEMTHLRHFDHLWSVLRCVALALHWFDPLAWMAAWLSKADGELACDEGVLAGLSREEATVYGSTLIQLSTRKGDVIMGMNSILDGKGTLRRRVQAIACRKRNRRSAAILAVALCMVTAGCTFTDAPVTTEPQLQDFQPNYVVWEKVSEHVLSSREDEILNSFPGLDSGEEWAEEFRENVKRYLNFLQTEYGAENTGLVFVKEIIDERAEPGVRIYEIRYHADQGNGCMERSDYMIVSENCKAWTADLESCHISGVFNVDCDDMHHGELHQPCE